RGGRSLPRSIGGSYQGQPACLLQHRAAIRWQLKPRRVSYWRGCLPPQAGAPGKIRRKRASVLCVPWPKKGRHGATDQDSLAGGYAQRFRQFLQCESFVCSLSLVPGRKSKFDSEYNKKVMPDSKVEHHLVKQFKPGLFLCGRGCLFGFLFFLLLLVYLIELSGALLRFF